MCVRSATAAMEQLLDLRPIFGQLEQLGLSNSSSTSSSSAAEYVSESGTPQETREPQVEAPQHPPLLPLYPKAPPLPVAPPPPPSEEPQAVRRSDDDYSQEDWPNTDFTQGVLADSFRPAGCCANKEGCVYLIVLPH